MVLVGAETVSLDSSFFWKTFQSNFASGGPAAPEVYTEGQKARLRTDCGINFGLWVKEAHTESNQTGRAWNQRFGSFVLLPILGSAPGPNLRRTGKAGSSEVKWKAQMKERDTEAEQEVTWRPTGSQQAFPSTPHKTARTSMLFFFIFFYFFFKEYMQATLSRSVCILQSSLQ